MLTKLKSKSSFNFNFLFVFKKICLEKQIWDKYIKSIHKLFTKFTFNHLRFILSRIIFSLNSTHPNALDLINPIKSWISLYFSFFDWEKKECIFFHSLHIKIVNRQEKINMEKMNFFKNINIFKYGVLFCNS